MALQRSGQDQRSLKKARIRQRRKQYDRQDNDESFPHLNLLNGALTLLSVMMQQSPALDARYWIVELRSLATWKPPMRSCVSKRKRGPGGKVRALR